MEALEEPEITDNMKKKIILTRFAQQEKIGWKLCKNCSDGTHGSVGYMTCVLSLIVLMMGFWYTTISAKVRMVEMTYEKGYSFTHDLVDVIEDFGSVKDREDLSALCEDKDHCKFEVIVNETIKDPEVFYTLGPFYQNYNGYMKSEVPEELRGEKVSEAIRESKCGNSTLTYEGKKMVPCGMKAASMFNDTIKISIMDNNGTLQPLTINKTGIAWPEDIESRRRSPQSDPSSLAVGQGVWREP